MGSMQYCACKVQKCENKKGNKHFYISVTVYIFTTYKTYNVTITKHAQIGWNW